MIHLLKTLVLTSFLLFPAGLRAQQTLEILIGHMVDTNYAAASELFEPSVREQLGSDLLRSSWERLQTALGAYTGMGSVALSTREDLITEESQVHFEQGSLKVLLSSTEGGVVGFQFLPLEYRLPTYGRALPVGKRYLKVEAVKGVKLEGELVIPAGCDHCPVVVLVHGSGPGDMDERIGPNKPFMDIALGLASKGVASFRYHKRTKVYPELFSDQFTLYEETIDDAVAAVRLVKSQEDLPLGPAFVAGHSLGGYAVPRILKALEGEVAGGIMLAAPSRGLDSLILEQTVYFAQMDDSLSPQELIAIAHTRERVSRIRTQAYTDATPATELMGILPPSYWRDLADYHPAEEAKLLSVPLLVVQGAKDCQVYPRDLTLWKEVLGERANYLEYPMLNHLLMPIEGRSNTLEYQVPNNVDEQLIKDLVQWLDQHQ